MARASHVRDFLSTVDDLIDGLLLRQEMILEAAGVREPEIREAINQSRSELASWAMRSLTGAEKAVRAVDTVACLPRQLEMAEINEERVLTEDGKWTMVYLYRGDEIVGTRYEVPRSDDEPA